MGPHVMLRAALGLVLAVLVLPLRPTLAQSAEPSAPIPTVQLDLATGRFEGSLPYWQEFFVTAKVGASVQRAALVWVRTGHRDRCKIPQNDCAQQERREQGFSTWVRPQPGLVGTTEQARFWVSSLRPGISYTFYVVLYGRAWMLPDQTPLNDTCLELFRKADVKSDPKRAYEPILNVVTLDSVEVTAPVAHHFDFDFGGVQTIRTGAPGLVSGTHFRLRPSPPTLDLLDKKALPNFREQLLQRVSLYAGIAPVLFPRDEVKLKNPVSLGYPMVGMGLRGALYWRIPWLRDQGFYRDLIQHVNLTAGVLWYQQDAANPLVNQDLHKRDAFVALSLDVDLKSVLGPFTKLFVLP